MIDIVHRDITPDNVLLDEDGHIQLTGWGLCCPDVNEEVNEGPQQLQNPRCKRTRREALLFVPFFPAPG